MIAALKNGLVSKEPAQIEQLKKTVSASRLNCWLQCRLKFFFRYVLKITKPKTAALHYGSVLHLVLQEWKMMRWRKQPFEIAKLKQTFDAGWQDQGTKINWDGEEPDQKSSAWGVAHANVGWADTLWSVPIEKIPLKARFKVINGGLVPMFASQTELEMPMVWKSPKEVQLVFVVRTVVEDESVIVNGNWLFAFNQENNGYRLPLPSLHDDCAICTGQFQDQYDSGVQCVTASLEQFNQSKWNSDLMRTIEQSQKFFRFRPTNETFETLPVEAPDWSTLCEKVSTAIMDRVIL